MSTEKRDQLYFENEAVREFVSKFRSNLMDAIGKSECLAYDDIDDVLAETLADWLKCENASEIPRDAADK